MKLVVDANVLVAQALRWRGRELIEHPLLRLSITDRAWDEAVHELLRRSAALERRGRLLAGQGDKLRADVLALAEVNVRQIPVALYSHLETEARRRIPRDPDDWPTVALALALDAAIWTHDNDFLGCGVATWTTDTLLAHLEA